MAELGERGFLLRKTDGTRDAPGTRRDTTAGLPPARGAFVLTATGGKSAAKQTNKKICHTCTKSLVSALASVLSCPAPLLLLPPQFRGWLTCRLCLFPGRGAGRAAEVRNPPQAPSRSSCDGARLILEFLFSRLSLGFSPPLSSGTLKRVPS